MGLETAQALGMIGSSVLWNGQTVVLVGVTGTQAEIAPLSAVSSADAFTVSLSDIDSASVDSHLISRNQHFSMPGVCRPLRSEPVNACSSEEPAEHDYSLDACFDPSSEAGRRELARQAASGNQAQHDEAVATITAVLNGKDEELKQQVIAALDEEAESLTPEELARMQQAYAEAACATTTGNSPSQSGAPTAGRGVTPNGGGNAGNGSTNGGGAPVGVSGNGTALAFNNAPVSDNGAAAPVLTLASIGNDGFVPLVSVMDAATGSIGGVPSGNGTIEEDPSAVLPAVVRSSSVPAVLNPFTFTFPAFLNPELRSVLSVPPSADASREAAFFQAVFGPGLTEHPSSDLMALLTHPTREFAPKVAEVRRAVGRVIQQYEARYGVAGPADRDATIPIVIRYLPESRRIEVTVQTTETHAARRPTSFDDIRSQFGSLAGYVVGSRDHLRDEFGFSPILASVYVPAQYLQGVRLGEDEIIVRADSRANNRAAPRVARRESSHDRNGGSRDGEREGRGSRGGRGGRHGGREDHPSEAEENPDLLVA